MKSEPDLSLSAFLGALFLFGLFFVPLLIVGWLWRPPTSVTPPTGPPPATAWNASGWPRWGSLRN